MACELLAAGQTHTHMLATCALGSSWWPKKFQLASGLLCLWAQSSAALCVAVLHQLQHAVLHWLQHAVLHQLQDPVLHWL